jgi:type I restriction enzyme R subunit
MYVDKRLAGIQAVQTLSRLNRAHPGKDTTYVLDFVNDPTEVLAAFKTYFETAELADVTDPNLVYDLKAKLDASGNYDEAEVERVVTVVMDARSSHGQLVAALEPVADRLLKRFKAASAALAGALDVGDARTEKEARDELSALILFKSDLGAFLRVYAFLSQMFDYGTTAVEKRAIFFKRLLPLLEFGHPDPPQAEGPGQALPGPDRGRGRQAQTPDRNRRWRDPRQGQGPAGRDYREGQHPVRG